MPRRDRLGEVLTQAKANDRSSLVVLLDQLDLCDRMFSDVRSLRAEEELRTSLS